MHLKRKIFQSIHRGEEILITSHTDMFGADWHLLLSTQRLIPIKKKKEVGIF